MITGGWLGALLGFLANLLGSIFNEAMNHTGETHSVEEKDGTLEIDATDPQSIADRYDHI